MIGKVGIGEMVVLVLFVIEYSIVLCRLIVMVWLKVFMFRLVRLWLCWCCSLFCFSIIGIIGLVEGIYV